jgi:hypothetical protein
MITVIVNSDKEEAAKKIAEVRDRRQAVKEFRAEEARKKAKAKAKAEAKVKTKAKGKPKPKSKPKPNEELPGNTPDNPEDG